MFGVVPHTCLRVTTAAIDGAPTPVTSPISPFPHPLKKDSCTMHDIRGGTAAPSRCVAYPRMTNMKLLWPPTFGYHYLAYFREERGFHNSNVGLHCSKQGAP